jgi:hypothetical protein
MTNDTTRALVDWPRNGSNLVSAAACSIVWSVYALITAVP